jgi:eukaryotic-like serine/threonine-protein kinase
MAPAKQPRMVGRYMVYDVIASGGMATVHLGRLLGPEGFSRTVAVKQLHPQFARDPEFVAMLLDEARLAARVRHPNVVSPLDVVVLDGELFVVMDYVQGESLSTLMKAIEAAPVPADIAVAIMIQVLLGLHAAHEATDERGVPLNIVHRDVSPQNVLVGADGLARVVDFGIAKAATRIHTTQEGKLKGKLSYMAPEQIRLEPPDRRTDVFTAGIVLWEMLTGHTLYPAESPGATVDRILKHKPEAPSELTPGLPAGLDTVTLRALHADPAERWQTARSMAQALEAALAPEGPMGVGAWVESVCGATLRARAEWVSDLEGVSMSSLPPVALERTSQEPRSLRPPDSTDLSLVPSGTEMKDAPLAGPRRRRRGLLIFVALLTTGAAISAVAAFTLKAGDNDYGRPDEPVVIEAPEEPEQPAVATKVGASPPAGVTNQPSDKVADPQPTPPASARTKSELDPPAVASRPRSEASKPSPRSQRSQSAPATSEKKEPAPQPPAQPSSRRKPAHCDPPYVIDANGHTRFKLECVEG